MDARAGDRLAVEQVRKARVGQIGIGHHQRITRITLGVGGLEQHGAGVGLVQVLAVLGVGQKGQLLGAGILQGGQSGDSLVGGATQGGAQSFGQFAESEC